MGIHHAIENLLQDFRLAARRLVHRPVFTTVAALSLALGIGANTAIFSVVDAVLLRPLPYPEPGRLVRIWETFTHPDGVGLGSVSVPNFRDWQEQQQSFEAVGAYFLRDVNLMGAESPSRFRATAVTPEVFPLLGVAASRGRALGAGDKMHDPVVVIGDELWRGFFGADPGLVGKTIRLDGENATVVGVMPPGFEFPPRSEAQLWIPLKLSETAVERRGMHWMRTVARLRPGVEPATAEADMKAIARRLETEYPEHQTGRSVALKPLADAVVAGQRPILLALWGAVGFVLLIACGNVANLLLARGAGQRTELAVRAALGAGRGRLARQVLLDSVLLALAGGGLGLAAGWQAVRYLASMPGSSLPTGHQVAFDVRIFSFSIAASLLAAVASGLLPAWRASRMDLQDAMRERSATGGGSHRDPARAALVIAEIALALVVLIGASLLVRSFWALQNIDHGVRTERVLTMRIPLPKKYDSVEKVDGFYSPLLERVEAIPGVESAGTIHLLPVQDWGWNGSFTVEGRPEEPPGQEPFAENRYVGGDYFQTLGIPLIAGRLFDRRDRGESPPVVLVNRTAARRYWGDESPVGRRIRFGEQEWLTIVGVVGDVHNRSLRQGVTPEIYFHHPQHSLTQTTLVVRTTIEPMTAVAAIREEIRRLDPEQPVFRVQTMDEVVATHLASSRFSGILFSLFAALALVLATLGVYGVMSYSVGQRTREIGLRMALGADRPKVLSLVLRQGLRLALFGTAAGVVVALGLTRFLQSQLFAVEPTDVATFAAVPLVLLAVAAVACLIPARRAASLEPTAALRHE